MKDLPMHVGEVGKQRLELRSFQTGGFSLSDYNALQRSIKPFMFRLFGVDFTIDMLRKKNSSPLVWFVLSMQDDQVGVGVSKPIFLRLLKAARHEKGVAPTASISQFELEFLFSRLLSFLEEVMESRVEISMVSKKPTLPCQKNLSCIVDDEDGYLNILFSQSSAYLVTRALGHLPSHELDVEGVRFSSSVVIGHYEASIHDIDKLSRGDLILPLAKHLSVEDGQLIIQNRKVGAVSLDGQTATITEFFSMTDTQTAEVGSLVDDVTVQLSFQIGAQEIGYDELKRLDRDQVFDLELPADQASVDILANGCKVATGELVSLGGNLAVQVRRLGRTV